MLTPIFILGEAFNRWHSVLFLGQNPASGGVGGFRPPPGDTGINYKLEVLE